MGIDKTLITTQIDPEMIPNFTCSICDDLLEDAVTLTCDHTFCRPCLTGWMERPGRRRNVPCPDCRHLFSPTKDIKEPSRLLRNLLSTIKFKCLNEGCDHIVPYGEFNLHKEECPYGLIACSYCQIEICRKDIETHEDGCISFVKYKKEQVELENKLLKDEINSLKRNYNAVDDENDSLKSQNDSLKRQNDSVNDTKTSLENELKRLKSDLEKERVEPQCVITLIAKIKSPTVFSFRTNVEVLHRQSSWSQIPGGKICVKFKKYQNQKIRHANSGPLYKNFVALALVKNKTTKTIDAEWSMKVWHEEGNKMVFTKDDCSHIFKKYFKVWNTNIKQFVPPEHNFIFTIKISKWIVTPHNRS